MLETLERGQTVTLLSHGGLISRTIVADLGEVLLVCLESEFRRAQAEGREPVSVGFRRSDMVPAQAGA